MLLHRHAVHVDRRVAYKQQHQPEPPRCGGRTEDRHDRLRVVSLCTHNPRRRQLAPTDARQRITTRHRHSAETRRTRSLTPTPRILHRTVPCSPPSMVLFTASRRLSPRAALLNHNCVRSGRQMQAAAGRRCGALWLAAVGPSRRAKTVTRDEEGRGARTVHTHLWRFVYPRQSPRHTSPHAPGP